MPLYSYHCTDCGDFRDWNDLDRSDERRPCPLCGHAAERGVSAPFLGMERNRRVAHERNERSAHEPKVLSRAQLDREGKRRSHTHSHGVHHGGKTWQRSTRRWMVGH